MKIIIRWPGEKSMGRNKLLTNHDVLEFPKVVSLLSDTQASGLRNKLLREIEEIRRNFFPNVNEYLFGIEYLGHESVVMKAAAYRFFSNEVFDSLSQSASKVLSTENSEFLIHPIFYVRVSNPRMQKVSPQDFVSGSRSVPFLESQPHYDRALGVFAYTFWLALDEVNQDTGGLCFFKDTADVRENFNAEWGQKNRYDFDTYLRNHERLDDFVRDAILREPHLEAGQGYLFHSNILHGAVANTKGRRISLDFRLIHKSDLRDAPSTTRDLVEQFNSDIALSQVYGLATLNDNAGVSNSSAKTRMMPSVLDKISKLADIEVPKSKMHWSLEYSWFKELANR